uniref:NADH-ubiquinone oxidoreductase chain 6 n=1 Tax=Pandalus hypsinotus TaxID=242778 RepID=A0A4D5XXJ7_PANHY|nr:NADH dehydrogenase subunit 6 [Pandalus hypsinotus]
MYLLIFTSLAIMLMSLLFIRVVHPLAAGTALLAQTIFICVAAGLQNKSMWFSYILFLIFLGAMLVLFIYVASLASNEAFNFSGSSTMTFVGAMVVALLCVVADPMIVAVKQSIEGSYLSATTFLSSQQLTLSMIYNPSAMNLTLFVIIFLLMTLIVVVKLTCTFFGPLRLS